MTANNSVIGKKLAVITVVAWRTELVGVIKASLDRPVIRVSQIALERNAKGTARMTHAMVMAAAARWVRVAPVIVAGAGTHARPVLLVLAPPAMLPVLPARRASGQGGARMMVRANAFLPLIVADCI